MPYATETALNLMWGYEQVTLAAWDEGAGMRNEARIADALAGASGVVDSYIGVRYPLPLVNLAPDGAQLLSDLTCDLAYARLCSTPGLRNDIVKEREALALKRLADIAAGKAQVALIPLEPQTNAPEEAVLISDPRRFGPYDDDCVGVGGARGLWRGL